MIAEFYNDCEIFITGGSGVVGKALIEFLLRCCNVRRIYILLRAKKNLSVEQRLEKICDSKFFRRLRSEKPHELRKVVAIPGDAMLPLLGVPADYGEMLQNVSIFFHCAATVRFDEPLRVAVALNVGGTLQALKFAETLSQLKLFMHVSTYYSNPYLAYVEPKLYPAPMDWRVCLKMMESGISDNAVDAITRKLIVGFPNTYTFTKNLAENLVNDFRDRLPVAIFRPSIVLFALNEPEPGYPPPLMGAMGLFALAGAGILKTVYLGEGVHLDMTPQDLCVKLMLSYAACAGEDYAKGNVSAVPVYMSSSRQYEMPTFKEIGELTNSIWNELAFEKCFMIPGCVYTASYLRYMCLVYTKQVLPAFLVDCLLRLAGRKPVLMSVVRKAFVSLHEMRAFMFNEFDSPGYTDFDRLVQITSGTDFAFREDCERAATYKGIRDNSYKMVYKIREILFKEDPTTLPKQRKVLRIKVISYNVIRAILAYFVLRWLYRAFLS